MSNDFGYEVAERLGLEAYHEFPMGDDGHCYLLEDGRVLKVTGSITELAVMLALKEMQARGLAHPSVPRIDDLRWTTKAVDLRDIGLGVREIPQYVAVREQMDDLDIDDAIFPKFRTALEHLNHGWRNREKRSIDGALAVWAPHGPHLRETLDGLEWVERHTGIRVLDIRPSNLGESKAGKVGMRDLGRAEVPERLLDRAKSLPLPAVPETPAPPAPRTGFGRR